MLTPRHMRSAMPAFRPKPKKDTLVSKVSTQAETKEEEKPETESKSEGKAEVKEDENK